MLRFRNKTVLITGAGSGIGEAMAVELAAQGANLILASRTPSHLDAVCEICRASGVQVWPIQVDVADTASVDAMVEQVRALQLVPDVLVLNAGISQRAMTLETDFSVDRKLMDINYFGAIYVVKKFKQEILSSKQISIAVTSSISGIFGFPMRSAYCASKRALFGFFESLELEYPNVRVTMLIPGRINTSISLSAITESGQPYAKMDPGQATGMAVKDCARVAVRAIAKGKHKQLIGKKELLMVHIYKYLPALYYKLARKISAV